MLNSQQPEIIDLNADELDSLLCRATEGAFEPEDYLVIQAVLRTYFQVAQLLDQKNISLARLRKLVFGSQSEKTAAVIGRQAEAPASANASPAPGESSPDASSTAQTASPDSSPAKKKRGHGRNGVDDYPGAERVDVPHPTLAPKDPCPECREGKVYEVDQPKALIRFVGRPPIQVTIYQLQKLRCGLCGKLFIAPPPAAAGNEKYDATVPSMIGVLKYASGVPFYRLQGLQESLGIPLPASTQWDVVSEPLAKLEPAYRELIRQAAQGEVVHNDDTSVRILEMMGTPAARPAALPAEEAGCGDADLAGRTGLFTSGVVATREGRRIALFFSGRKHAGENLMEVLRQRAADLPPPIQMCDALSRNLPDELQTIVANCLAHGRRPFVDVHDRFPDQCQFVLESLAVVYRTDALARERNLSPAERLALHQAESGPTMKTLRDWLRRQFDERLVEPNSALGAAFNYLRKHWDKLTLFLRVPGAPLDNNLCERALKKVILHRKNALFYKTQNGANVGDRYMSLTYTCELNDANPFDYVTQLQRHADEVAAAPDRWMPWNYRQQLTPG